MIGSRIRSLLTLAALLLPLGAEVLAQPSLPPAPPRGARWQMVGNRCGIGYVSASTSSLPNQVSRTKHAIYGQPSMLQPVWAGFDLGGNSSNGTDEHLPPLSNYRVGSIAGGSSVSGGSGFVSRGEIITGPTTGSGANATSTTFKLATTLITSGAATKAVVVDPGSYDTIPADPAAQSGSSQASDQSQGLTSTQAGVGSTWNLNWDAAGPLVRFQIEPDFASPATAGINAPRRATWKRPYDNSDSPDWFIPPGGLLRPEPVPISLATSPAYVGLRLWTHGAGLARWRNTLASVDYFGTGTSGDVTANTNLLAGNSQGQFTPPTYWHGWTDARLSSGIALGDSITYTATTSGTVIDPNGDADGNHGWFERGMGAAGIGGYCNFSRSGQSLQRWFVSTAGRQNRLRAIREARPDWVIVAYWANDLPNITAAQLAAYEAQLVAELRGVGVKRVFGVTGTPLATTSDGYTTVAGQTSWVDRDAQGNIVGTRGAENQTRNANLRANPAPYDAVFDFAAIAESSPGSGKWRVLNPDGSGVGTRYTASAGATIINTTDTGDVHGGLQFNIDAAAAFAQWIVGVAPRN